MTLEEVVKNKDKLPPFAVEAVENAYHALRDMWGFYVCKNKPTQDDAFNNNVVRCGLGLPRRYTVRIVEKHYPITYCELDISPTSWRLEDFFRGIVKHGEYFRSFKEVDEIIPREVPGILNNGHKLRVMLNGEKELVNGIELIYEEVLPN